MIGTEISVFVALLLSGLGTGVLACFLLALGGGSRSARAIFDFLTPLSAGAIFFFALLSFAGGVFRLYSAVAYLLGLVLGRRLVGRTSPWLSRLVKRAKVPIKSLEKKVENVAKRLFSPWVVRYAAKKAERKEKRNAARLLKEEKRKERRLKSNAKRKHAARRPLALRRHKMIDNAREARYNTAEEPYSERYYSNKVSDTGAVMAGFRSRKRAARHIRRI